MGNRNSFTLIELIIVLIVLAILSAIAIPIYQNQVEKVKADKDAAILEVNYQWYLISCMKDDISPAGMSRLWDKYRGDASVVVWEKSREKRNCLFLVYATFQNCRAFLSDISSVNTAYAVGPNVGRTGTTCVPKSPSDPRPDEDRVSFGLNQDAAGKSYHDIKDPNSEVGRKLRGPAGQPVPIITEYNGSRDNTAFTYTPGDYSFVPKNRHRKGGVGFGLFIDINGIVYAIAETKGSVPVLYRNWW